MKIDEMFPSRFLKESDLDGREVPVIIVSVEMDDLQVVGTSKTKRAPVVTLKSTKTGKELDKSLVLNKTNALAIATMYGNDTAAWVGKTIVLRPAQDRFQGKLVPCIRIRTREPGEEG